MLSSNSHTIQSNICLEFDSKIIFRCRPCKRGLGSFARQSCAVCDVDLMRYRFDTDTTHGKTSSVGKSVQCTVPVVWSSAWRLNVECIQDGRTSTCVGLPRSLCRVELGSVCLCRQSVWARLFAFAIVAWAMGNGQWAG